MNKGFDNLQERDSADAELLKMAIDTGKYFICDMRPASSAAIKSIQNAIYFQPSQTCSYLLRALIQYRMDNVLLVTDFGSAGVNLAWLRKNTNRIIQVIDESNLNESCFGPAAINTIMAETLADLNETSEHVNLIDVRSVNIFDTLHVAGSQNIPLDQCPDYISVLDRDKRFYVYGDYDADAMCFISLLKYWGYTNLLLVSGGFSAIEQNDRFYMVGND